MKAHTKSIAAPKTWNIKRKKNKFTTRPNAGAHKKDLSMPLNLIIENLIKSAKTTKEVKHLLAEKQIFVDGKARTDNKYSAGLMDVVSIPSINKYFRIILNPKGKLVAAGISKEESELKPCKIVNKKLAKGKIQLNFGDGRNLFIDKNSYSTGDTLLIKIQSQEIMAHFKLEKNSGAYLSGGSHLGMNGKILEVQGNTVTLEIDGEKINTSKEHVFVISDEKKSQVTVEENKG